MKKFNLLLRAVSCVLAALLLLPLSSCGLISEILNEALGALTADTTAAETVPDTTEVEPPETRPQWEYVPDADEVFASEAAREAARIADSAIAEAYRALCAFPDNGEIEVYDYDPANHPTAYATLSESRREIYDTVYNAVSSFGAYSYNEKAEPAGFISHFLSVHDALKYDHPDIFMYYSFSSRAWDLFPVYFMPDADANSPAEDVARVRYAVEVFHRTVDRIVDKIPAGITNYQKCIYLCAVITAICTYDYSLASSLDAYPPYGTLILGTCVCKGYADTFLLLANAAGIECDRTWGSAGGGEHVWNRVQTSRGELYIDPTWTDNSVENHGYDIQFTTRFFMMTADDLDFEGYRNVTNHPEFLPDYSGESKDSSK